MIAWLRRWWFLRSRPSGRVFFAPNDTPTSWATCWREIGYTTERPTFAYNETEPIRIPDSRYGPELSFHTFTAPPIHSLRFTPSNEHEPHPCVTPAVSADGTVRGTTEGAIIRRITITGAEPDQSIVVAPLEFVCGTCETHWTLNRSTGAWERV